MGKHNRIWTESSIDQVLEMEITWNCQCSNFLVKCPFVFPCYVYKFAEWNYAKPWKKSWMDVQGDNILTKNNDTKDSKNYWPIACLSTTYKLPISVLTDRTCLDLEQNDLSALEKKGCRRGLYGSNNQLMINKIILENCQKRKQNLSCAWIIDYKKAFNSVPYEWILRSLELFKISPSTIGFLKHNMKRWKTKLTFTHKCRTLMSDTINIKGYLPRRLFILTTLLYFTHTTLIRAEFLRLWI